MRSTLVSTALVGVLAVTLSAVPAEAEPVKSKEYVVLYGEGVTTAKARAAVKAAGGTIVDENAVLGVATVTSDEAGFTDAVASSGALDGAAENRAVGYVPKTPRAANPAEDVEKVRGTGKSPKAKGKSEPLDNLQWDMAQIDAAAAHKVTKGSKDVLVGIMDTGVDAYHPDIRPNFDFKLSRNFTVDLPADANGTEIDGACADDPDGSCEDPATVDENEHGTHVASTIASPSNGEGIAGVAPNVRIVNLRTGQDSGYFFLKPTLDALAYAADNGVDVVNMSYYVDPWLWNCSANPADSADEQEQQRVIVRAANRALNYAHRKGVTLVAAAGNDLVDYTKTNEDSGPDYATFPGQQPRPREVPASCVSIPSEGDHVIPVSSTGISERKAYYSSFGKGYVAVAAPGGDKVDTADKHVDDAVGIWAAYPESVGRASGSIAADGTPTVPWVVKQGDAYYQSLQGTSMASPHAAGVAALIVSRYGKRDRANGGLTYSPDLVEARLRRTAVPHPCPAPATFTYEWYTRGGALSTSTQTCEGSRSNNGFYGNGIINAFRAVK
ncbi:subtilisin family serine protease [Actinocorallia herbida]|uniref:Subtilisin family serine protease n=1 Tax=Actinocorallia herbida TaxID=58109 RepID=A0A3N1DAL3_9ACTN|nr:S8 family serine peptidase [Actinocorallia herbida]ROO90572.1 subtilisin family serine protease [Actinocorallia herbida]